MTMVLVIRNMTFKDFGSYRCVAQNSLGKTDGLIRLYGNGPRPEMSCEIINIKIEFFITLLI